MNTESEWISVDDRLPDKEDYYLVWYNKFREPEILHWRGRWKGADGDVMYWMLLPPPPEARR